MEWYYALLGVVPALVVMAYVDRLDAKRPEPRGTLRKIAIIGALSVVPAIVIELVLMAVGPEAGTYENAIYSSFVVAAGTEELMKVLVVYWFVWHLPEFDERMDGIVYATRAGLGFAAVENVFYLYGATGTDAFWHVFVMRALLAVPGHAIWAGIMGYYAARRRFEGAGIGLVGGFLIAVLLHGAYDAAIFVQAPLQTLGGYGNEVQALALTLPIIIIGGGIALRRMARRAVEADDADEARGLIANRAGAQVPEARLRSGD